LSACDCDTCGGTGKTTLRWQCSETKQDLESPPLPCLDCRYHGPKNLGCSVPEHWRKPMPRIPPGSYTYGLVPSHIGFLSVPAPRVQGPSRDWLGEWLNR
jgi:hypothetical protein